MGKWYPNAKVYCDGFHYVAIPYEPNPSAQHKHVRVEPLVEVEVKQEEVQESKAQNEETQQTNEASTESSEKKKTRYTTRKDEFERLYRESLDLKPRKRKRYIIDGMKKVFPNEERIWEYVYEQCEAKEKALQARKQRFMRKVHLNKFNYFATFTYDDAKMDEATFQKKLCRCLQNFHTHRGWTYMGVWERGSDTERLHFHCLLNVPDGQMPGEIVETKEYDYIKKRKIKYEHNTFFDNRFGRNEFDYIEPKGPMQLCHTIDYILKYLEKSGERIVCSRGLPTYVMSDIEEKDVATRTGMDEKKLLLFDDFDCWDEGVYVGKNSEETRKQLRTSN